MDTDTTSNYLDIRRINPVLRARIEAQPRQNVYISIVTVEEMLRGILALLSKARKNPRSPEKIIEHCATLYRLIHALSDFTVLQYDEAAELKYREIPTNLRKRFSQDCHIAAIAAINNFTVVTSNIRDFEGMNVARCVDWMVTESPDGLS